MKALIFSLLVAGAFAATASRTHHSKISGGADPVDNAYDYFVSLKDVSDTEYFCGGAVYNENYIITSAQCVYSYPEEPTDLVVVTWTKATKERDTGKENLVDKIIVHEQYGLWTRSHDIALLHLTTPLVLGDFKGIALESGEAKDSCFVTGLPGPTSKDVVNPAVKQAEVNIITDVDCREDYKPTQILHSMICAKGKVDGVKVDLSDYGGPLVCNGKLAGVMSWGKEYLDSKFPEVYTEISYFDDWIKNIAGPPV